MTRDLILKREQVEGQFSGVRFQVFHKPTNILVGRIAREGGAMKSWHWSIMHPFEQCRAGQHSGRWDKLDEAQADLAKYWRESPLPEGMVEHEGFAFAAFKPPRDIPWTIKITRRDVLAFTAPGYDTPQLIAWVRFDAAESADETIAMARRAIDDAEIVVAA